MDVTGHSEGVTEMRGSMAVQEDVDTAVDELTVEETRALLDSAARRTLGMTGDDFIRAWDHGLLKDNDSLAVMEVAALIPGVR